MDKPWKIAKLDMTFQKPEIFSGVVFSLANFNRGRFYNIRSRGYINLDCVELIHINPTLLVFLYETDTKRCTVRLTPKEVCINDVMFEEVNK